MKKLLVIAFLAVTLGGRVSAQLMEFLDAPQDSGRARLMVEEWTEVKVLRTNYEALIRTKISPLKLAEITNFFGAKLAAAPTNIALPLAERVTLPPGAGQSTNGKHLRHTDWYVIGDVGYVKIYFQDSDGESVDRVAIYGITDDGFVALGSTGQYAERIGWENRRYEKIAKWMEERGKLKVQN